VMIDEMLDQGTDEQGVNAAIEILKKMSRDRRKNVTLISHRDDLTSRIDSVLMVTKENGFTKFEAI
jgi:DNA repair exonuclease SbcCD ATPase subunit